MSWPEHELANVEEVLATVRRRTPMFIVAGVLIFIAVALSSFGLVLIRDNADAVRALNQQIAVIEAQTQQQEQAYLRFLQQSVAEQNYICAAAAAYAQQIGLPPPKPGQCAVSLPPAFTPKPSPQPTPQPTPAPPQGGTQGSAPSGPVATATAPPPVAAPVAPPRSQSCVHATRNKHC